MQSPTHLDAKTLEMMQRAVDRGASLIRQLLAFSRQEPLKTEKLDLNVLIREFEPTAQQIADGEIQAAHAAAVGRLLVELSGVLAYVPTLHRRLRGKREGSRWRLIAQ